MRKYPFVKQEEQTDCASSCILMILKYYGAYVSLEEIRDDTKTSKVGVSIYNLVETLKKYGFEVEALKGDIDNIKNNNITFPFISHMNICNGHYVVVYEINYKKKTVLIGDPGSKLKTVPLEEFEKNFNNIIITMHPIKKLPYKYDKVDYKDYVIYYIKNQKSSILTICLFSFIVTIFTICLTYYFQFIINGLNENKTNSYFIFILIIFLLLGIIKEITSYMKNKVYNYVKYNFDIEMNYDVYKKLIYLPFKYYADRSIGDILSRINNMNATKNFMCDLILNYVLGLIISVISFVLLIITNKSLALLSMFNTLIYVIIALCFNNYFKDKIKEIQCIKSDEIGYLTETISSYNTIKGINLYKYVLNKYKNKLRYLSYNYFKISNIKEIEQFLKNLISVIFNTIIIYYGAIMIKNKELTIGTLITFNYLYNYMFEPIKVMVDSSLNVNEMKSSIKRITELYYYDKNHEKGIIKDGNIKYTNLNFSYNYNRVLKNINLKIRYGEKVIVVGESGSGKSTLFKLLLKYYDVDMNQIFIDNTDINNINGENISTKISYISQNENVFTGSLYDNLVLDSNASFDEVEQVVNETYVKNIMNNLGYKMFIEEGGFNLSGGEKYRIVLARTLLKKPNVLIIDEGLSSVDVNLERKILKNILRKNMTIIFISHRLDNVDLFERKIELEKGRIKNDISICRT